MAAVLAAFLAVPGLSPAHAANAAGQSLDRPKVAVVLAGGGAKGIAHVGVLKVLDEAGVKPDFVVGTSMGSIVGGLYAMGYSGAELEKIVGGVDWENLFVDDMPRQEQTIRRKGDDIGFLSDARVRFKDGSPRVPLGAIKGQRLTLLLQDLTRPVADVHDFDKLPIPFRAVAADLITGDEVVIGSGSLPAALRASMSVPGAFPPVEIDGRLLVDGGIVNNVPISVARAMGADIVIVANFGGIPPSKEQITSALAVLGQTMDVMIDRATRAQLKTLGEGDLLITLEMGTIGTASFDKSKEALVIGETTARRSIGAFERIARAQGAMPGTSQTASRRPVLAPAPVTSIRFTPGSGVDDKVLLARMKTRPGQMVNPDQLDKDMGSIYGLGMFETVSYQLEPAPGGTTVVVDAVQHPSGKDYLRVGARLTNDFNGESTYDLSLSYTVPAIGRLNAEWRTQIVFGQTMALQTEWYQPLDPAGRFFVKPSVFIGERTVNLFQDAEKIAEVRVGEFRGQLATGINVSNDLSLAIGYEGGAGWAREKTGTGAVPKDNFETGRLFAGLAYDTMDTLNFPHEGQFVVMKYVWSDRALGADTEFQGFQGTASAAFSFGRNTFLVTGSASLSWDGALDAANVYELGGPLRLSGLPDKAISGSEALLARVVYYRELTSFGPSILSMPLYAGASLEYGGVFDSIDAIDWDGMKVGGSVFIGMDTVLGPLLLGVGFTEGGHEAVFLSMGSFF